MGGGMDLTSGPIAKTMFVFMLPVLGTNVLQSLNATVNTFWVSHSLGDSALAAVANANIIMMLLMGAVFGISMASNILIAQAVGAGDTSIVKKSIGTAISFFFIVSSTLAVFGWIFSPQILDMMGTPQGARPLAIQYLRVVFITTPFIYFFMFLQMAQRGSGDSKTPFFFTLIAITIGIILNPLLINGYAGFPKLGIVGSALSTFFGQAVALVLLVAHMYRQNSMLLLRPGEFHLLKPDPAIIQMLFFRGLPMGFQMFVMSGAAVVMIGFVNAYNDVILTAAYAAASQVWTYVQMPAMALGASVSSMAGQNIGAQKWDRVDRVALTGVFMGLGVTSVVAIAIYLTGPLTLMLFLQPGSAAIPVAEHINHIVLWSFVVFAINFTLSGVVRATGAVWPPLIILIISMWVIRVPFAHFLQPVMGQDAIWWSFPFGTITSAVLSALYFAYGGWRKMRLLPTVPDSAAEVSDTGLSTPIAEEGDVIVAAAQHATDTKTAVFAAPAPLGPRAAWAAAGSDLRSLGRSVLRAFRETWAHLFPGGDRP
jgi:putative MATE family efflux protein